MAEPAPHPAPCAITDVPRGPEKPGAPAVVEFRSVTKTFAAGTARAFTAIRDVTFRVEDTEGMGEFVVLLGPSGCGKSTVLRLIAGLGPHHPASSGEVLLGGRVVTGPGPDRGMVFQDYTSFDNRTVVDNVAFGLECRGMARTERRQLAKEWIAKVGLDPVKDAAKYPHQLSGGMRQRVAIARTLILKPRVILMDEPFGALDPATRHNMQDLLLSLWQEVEATVFFVIHDVNEAVFLGDRCYIFSNSPGAVLHQFRIAAPDRPARPMMREKSFQDTVYYIRDILDTLEEGRT